LAVLLVPTALLHTCERTGLYEKMERQQMHVHHTRLAATERGSINLGTADAADHHLQFV